MPASPPSEVVEEDVPPRRRPQREAGAMERVIERRCGLDVHKKTVAACVWMPGPRGEREQQVRTFGTTAVELLALRD